MNFNSFSSLPDSDKKSLNELVSLIENLKNTSELNDFKYLIDSITWKEKIDQETALLLEDSNVDFFSLKSSLESYKTTLKLKL